ncbi:unnamed protein product [Brachionus calyciflorus]|uniref:Uncharacterized protein n=1 Tax=Brachionus calyciflorus TaxID=104777 RepID=A0A813X4P6_9BILA|nr:unnamed protein product [Brachionus calyciflorus]
MIFDILEKIESGSLNFNFMEPTERSTRQNTVQSVDELDPTDTDEDEDEQEQDYEKHRARYFTTQDDKVEKKMLRWLRSN